MFTPLTQQLQRVLDLGVPGFDCMVMHRGTCVYRNRCGYTDPEAKVPVTGSERFYLYSCSKPITCTAALQLWEQGLLELDAPVSRYLPEFAAMQVREKDGLRPAAGPITVRHLFTMTGGFSYDLKSPMLLQCRQDTDGRCPTREVMKYLAREPLGFDPGASFRYSLCHDVLAAVAEVISGMSFGAYVKKNIFDPLGMTHSSFRISEDERQALAPQFTCKIRKHISLPVPTENEFILGPEYESGGAGCVSTVEDMMRFAEALRLGDRILRKETIAMMASNALSESQMQEFWVRPYGYGLGVRCPRDSQVTDFGWDGAAGCYLAIDPAHEMSLFYAQQVLNAPVNLLHHGFLTAAQQVMEENF